METKVSFTSEEGNNQGVYALLFMAGKDTEKRNEHKHNGTVVISSQEQRRSPLTSISLQDEIFQPGLEYFVHPAPLLAVRDFSDRNPQWIKTIGFRSRVGALHLVRLYSSQRPYFLEHEGYSAHPRTTGVEQAFFSLFKQFSSLTCFFFGSWVFTRASYKTLRGGSSRCRNLSCIQPTAPNRRWEAPGCITSEY